MPRTRAKPTEDESATIVRLVQNGNDVYTAGWYVKATRDQVDRWLQNREFREAVETARATLELEQTALLSGAAREGSSAAIKALDDRRREKAGDAELRRLRELTT